MCGSVQAGWKCVRNIDSLMKRLLNNVMTILLIVVVLASSALPPAVCHAHSEGTANHSHGRNHAALAANGQPNVHVHHHDVAVHSDDAGRDHTSSERLSQRGDVGIVPAAAHLHILVAGFDFTWPLSNDNGANGPLEPTRDNALHFVMYRFTDDTISVSRVQLSVLVTLSASAPVAAVSLSEAAAQTARWLCVCGADRMLLCDSARCERSGVLLI